MIHFNKKLQTNSKVEKLTKRHATIEDMNESRPLPKRKKQIKSNVLVPEELLNEKVIHEEQAINKLLKLCFES